MAQKIRNGILGISEMLRVIGRGILDAVFPARCAGCEEEGYYICKRCEGFASEVALICPLCRQSSLTGERHENCKSLYGFAGLASIWEYEGVVKSLLHSIKYNGITHAAAETVQRAYGDMIQDVARFKPFLSYLFSQDTCITYVPMFKRKERARGFNQAAVFAKEIGKVAKKEVLTLLQKIKDTKSQTELDKKERLENVKDSFELAEQTLNKTQNRRGKIPERVVLVDDVWTTGATVRECCRVLKKAGVKEVWGFTIARTP